MSNEIIKLDGAAGAFLGFCESKRETFSHVETFSEMLEEVKQVENAKKLLEIAEEYHKVAGEYCALEAEAMFRLSELKPNESDNIGTKLSRLIRFLRDHAGERESIINVCKNDAMSIYAYKKQQDMIDRNADAKCRMHDVVDSKIEEYKRFGRTAIGTTDLLKGHKVTDTNVRVADGMNERLRDKLLRMGAVGIGNGVYVKPSKDNAEKALRIRLDSIEADINALADLIKLCGYLDYATQRINAAVSSLSDKTREAA